ncbi:hypothetical protein M0R88_09190 [Halorussus gelatinilyticus]|uniref:Uncharacterized protein n=1 Tax=Halorussus gelatinilyticus TaxID=2937524 RepID=A0A8U0IQE7_9EURY|nr:hypothetical protein [Halorussus gelatinilyticus]UPW02249.1 hypothetical protein M0R88_09190 [Halorussus gelatinilyticus]
MSRRALVAVVALVGVLGAGVLFAGGTDLGGESGIGAGDATATETATTARSATGTTAPAADDAGESGGGNDATATTSMTSSEYAFTIENIEKCGSTCRDVTARLTNSGGETRENVRVTTAMLADGEVLWSGNESVGTLTPGESHVSTERVDVGFAGGMQISANDGYVTIVTVVRSESGKTRFAERRKVA